MSKLETLRALCEKATESPWEVKNDIDVFTELGAKNAAGRYAAHNDGWHIAHGNTGRTTTCGSGEWEKEEELSYEEKCANARLISAARNELPALLELVEMMGEAIAAMSNQYPYSDYRVSASEDAEAALQAYREWNKE